MSQNLFGMGDEREFKRQFAVQFLASWVATHYTEYCARGMQETLETPPVEDAEYLAQKAWEQWCSIILKCKQNGMDERARTSASATTTKPL